jgi:hypothetical protein
MTGAHRQADQHGAPSAVKSVRWLLEAAGVIAVVAGLGFGIYLAVTNSKLFPIALMTTQGIVAVELARRLALEVVRDRAPSPVVLADWIDDSAVVIAWAALFLANIGEHQGWMHGAFQVTMLGVLGLFVVGMPLYWWRGKQRVVQALTGRAVAGQWPWAI